MIRKKIGNTRRGTPKLTIGIAIFLGALLRHLFDPWFASLKPIYDEDFDHSDEKKVHKTNVIAPSQDEIHSMPWTVPQDIKNERKVECEGRKVSSTGGFCLTKKKNIGGNQMFDRPMAEFLGHHVFAGATVVDLGAGLGHYGKIFREEGSRVAAWNGYDGAINVEAATGGLVRFMDLTQPHAADERPCVGADWVMSLEVAEHIPPQFTDAYLRNVRCRAKVGLVLSWAHPRQRGGLQHVNMKTEEKAIEAVERWGFHVDWNLTHTLRKAAKLDHFKLTTTVYRLAPPA